MPSRLIRGVRVRLGLSFALVFLLMAAVGRLPEAVTMFGIVLFHELAHSVVAWRLGLRVQQIELTPIGGVARIDALFEADPQAEFAVSIAGPLSNFGLAFVGWLALRYNLVEGAWWGFFVYANLWLGLFNLIPALPLDGGRIYRSHVVRHVGYREATARAIRLSKVLAVILFVVGIVGSVVLELSITLVFLALFVYMAARRERANAPYMLIRCMAVKREELGRVGWLRALHLVAQPSSTVKELCERLIPQHYSLVWVVGSEGKVLGMLTETQILDAFFSRGMHTKVSELLRQIKSSP